MASWKPPTVKLAEATELWLLERTRKLPSVLSAGSSSTSPRVATAVVTAFRRAAAILEPTSEEVSTAESRAYAVRALASALEACSPEMEASRLASSEASAAAVTTPRRALATLVLTSSGVILAAMSRECWSTTVLRP